MGQAIKILPITERFITEYNRLKDGGKLPPNTELAELMDINTPSTISNILKRKQNIQPEAWEKFRTRFRISEAEGNGTPAAADFNVLDRLMKQLESRADELKADKERLYGIIENYLNSIQANSVKTQDDLKILKAQADIVIKQIARQDEAILQSQLPKSEIVKGDKVKRGV